MQNEHCFSVWPYDVDVRKPMIVRVDHDAQSIEPQDGGHDSPNIAKPKRLGNFFDARPPSK